MKVCVPVSDDGQVGPGMGAADRLAVAEVVGRRIIDWQEIDVGWGHLHDQDTEGAHHATVGGSCAITTSKWWSRGTWGRQCRTCCRRWDCGWSWGRPGTPRPLCSRSVNDGETHDAGQVDHGQREAIALGPASRR